MKKLIMIVLLCVTAASFASKQLLDTMSENFKTKVTINVLDQPVNDILTTLSDYAGINLVQSEDTKTKKITLSLKEIPVKDAFDLVIRATDLSYQILDNSVIVASPEKIDREIGFTTTVIDLQYASAEKVKETLVDITKKVQVDPIGNRIIFQGSPKIANEVQKVVARIDRPLPQVLFKTQIKEIGSIDNSKLGLDWSKVNNYTTKIIEGSVLDWGTWEHSDEDGWTFTYDQVNPPKRDLSGDHSLDGPVVSNNPSGYGPTATAGLKLCLA